MADEPERKRIKSTICGATLEDGSPCPTRAQPGDRWTGEGYRCVKHGGGNLCQHVEENVRCGKNAAFDGESTKFCTAHQSAKMRCVECNVMIKYGKCHHNRSMCVPCRHKEDERGRELVARLKRNARLRELYFEEVFKRQGYRCANSVHACYDVAMGASTTVCLIGDREPLRDGCELDHKVRVADGGVDEPDNLQVLCGYCHNVKSAGERRG